MIGTLFIALLCTLIGGAGLWVAVQPTATAEEQDRIVRGEPAKRLLVQAEWDGVTCTWFVSSDDIPGLVAEATTVEALNAKLKHLVPFLLEANGWKAELTTPIELVARRFSTPGAA